MAHDWKAAAKWFRERALAFEDALRCTAGTASILRASIDSLGRVCRELEHERDAARAELAEAEATVEQLQISRAGWKDRAEKAEKRIAELRGRFVSLVDRLGGDGVALVHWDANKHLAHDSDDPTDEQLAKEVWGIARFAERHAVAGAEHRLGEQLAEALAALRPFAGFADSYDDAFDPDSGIVAISPERDRYIDVENLRRARAVLARHDSVPSVMPSDDAVTNGHGGEDDA